MRNNELITVLKFVRDAGFKSKKEMAIAILRSVICAETTKPYKKKDILEIIEAAINLLNE